MKFGACCTPSYDKVRETTNNSSSLTGNFLSTHMLQEGQAGIATHFGQNLTKLLSRVTIHTYAQIFSSKDDLI